MISSTSLLLIQKLFLVVYGVTTGFGKFANVVIPPNELELLQKKLIQSHSAGVGDPLSIERTRMMFALRINVLCKGFSGISISNLEILVQAFNGIFQRDFDIKTTISDHSVLLAMDT